MDNTLKTRNKIVQICSCLAVYLIALLFAILAVVSVIQTCRIEPSNPALEVIT